MNTGHKTITLPSSAPVTPVPPFIQTVAHICMLITQLFSDLKCTDTIQLLICTAGLDCCSVLSLASLNTIFLHYHPTISSLVVVRENSYAQKLFSHPVLLNSSSLSLPLLLQQLLSYQVTHIATFSLPSLSVSTAPKQHSSSLPHCLNS